MADQPSAFSKKNLQTITIDPEAKQGLLEELNLPPQMISFIRQYTKQLQTIGVCIVVLSVAWASYDYYTEKQREHAASDLAAALQLKDDQSRVQALTAVESEYGSTSSATWSRVELANIAYNNKNLDEALQKYKAVLADLDNDNPLTAVVRLSIAQIQETEMELDQALSAYLILSETPGFSGEGLKGMGRIYEQQGNTVEAEKAYQEYLASDEGLPAGEIALITSKLARIKERSAAAQ